MKPIVCIALEVKLRELDGLLYLATRCVELGFPVLIGPRSRIWRFFKKDAKDIPIFYIAKEMSNLDELKTRNMKIFNLDEEGGAEYTVDGLTRTPSIPEQDKIEKIFVWGESHRDHFIKQGADPRKVVVTGHPRFDLKKEKFFDFYRNIKTEAKRPEKYILLNSNWGSLHYMVGIENVKKLHHSIGKGTEKIDDLARRDAISIQRMVPLVKRLASLLPSIDIVIRPHPLENPEHYKKYFNEQNIKVIKEGNSQQWIVDALAIIHRDCATGLESFFAKKAVVSYIGDEVLFRENLAILLSRWTENEDEAVRLVQEAIANEGKSFFTEAERQEKNDILKSVIANIGFDSAAKIAEILNSAISAEESYSLPPRKNIIYRLAKRVRRFLKGDRLNTLDLIVKHKFPGLTLKEVRTRVDGITAAVPSLPQMDVVEYDVDTFLITRQ